MSTNPRSLQARGRKPGNLSGGQSHLTRRRLLGAGGVLAAAALAGCDLSTEPTTNRGRTGGSEDRTDTEAPMLAKLVKSGDLPPVKDRLPDSPVEIEPLEEIGVYGGTWQTALLGAADTPWLTRTIGYEPPLRWDSAWKGTLPNVAESVEASEDGREFLITFRSGIKWSDGKPFTTDDVVFAYEDVLRNVELTPAMLPWLVSGDEPANLEQIDDTQVRFTFKEPAGLFLEELARPGSGDELVDKPRHYLEPFHAAYGTNADQLAEEEGFPSWTELFLTRMESWENKDKPSLHAWLLKSELGEGSRVVAERNPYYWKVDSEGRQLPYLDEVVFDVLADEEVILLKATNGELSFHTRHVNTVSNKPVIAQGRETGGYDFMTLQSSFMSLMVISLNLTHEDPVKREIFGNKDFRIGLSYAINREELNSIIFLEQGEPWQAAPRRESRFFDEEFATQYLAYDLDLANEHLDKAGYRERDGDGYRLGPDGKRITFSVEVAPGQVDFWVDAMDLVVGYWDEVGIKAQVKSEDRSLFQERTIANQHEAGVWLGPGGLNDEIFRAFYYFPMQDALQSFATLWVRWFKSKGSDETAEQPPAEAVRQMELYWQLQQTAGAEECDELFRELLAIGKEQFWVIGTIMVPEGYGIVRNDFHNVPGSMPESADYNDPAPTNPQQYFIE